MSLDLARMNEITIDKDCQNATYFGFYAAQFSYKPALIQMIDNLKTLIKTNYNIGPFIGIQDCFTDNRFWVYEISQHGARLVAAIPDRENALKHMAAHGRVLVHQAE